MFWTLNSICTHVRQILNSLTLHHTQHRLHEILKVGHGLTQSQGGSGRGFFDNRGFFEKHLAYQLSLALPEMLRVFHHQWSKHLQGPVPDVPYEDTDRRSTREVFHQRRGEWTVLWGPDAYEELDEEGEAAFVSTGSSKGMAHWIGNFIAAVCWACFLWFILA